MSLFGGVSNAGLGRSDRVEHGFDGGSASTMAALACRGAGTFMGREEAVRAAAKGDGKETGWAPLD